MYSQHLPRERYYLGDDQGHRANALGIVRQGGALVRPLPEPARRITALDQAFALSLQNHQPVRELC